MPLYTYACAACGSRQDLFAKIVERNKLTQCPNCSEPMERLVSAPAVRGDYEGYSCPITGQWVEGRKAHNENLAKHGCRIYEPGETREAQRRKAAEDEAFLEKVADTAAQAVMKMPVEKREQLAKELDSGASVAYTRNAV